MNQEPCEKYTGRATDYVQGALGDNDARDMREHADTCPACRVFLASFEDLENALASLALPADEFPAINLLDGVLDRVHALQSLAPEDADSDTAAAEAVIGFLDDDLDEMRYRRIARQLEVQPALRQEVRELADMAGALTAAGDAWRANVPEIDIVAQVMTALPGVEACDDELDCDFSDLEADLEALGECIAANIPRVDLVDDVLYAIAAERTPATVTPFRARPRIETPVQSSRAAWRWLTVAAAACLVAGLGATLWLSMRDPGDRRFTMASNTSAVQPENLSHKTFMPVSPLNEIKNIPKEIAPGPEGEAPSSKKEAVTLRELLDTQRKVLLHDSDALKQMGQWASLDPDQARELLRKMGLSPEAIVGASQFLDPEEAAAVLRAAVKENPDNPYLRSALAMATVDDPAKRQETVEQLDAWSELEPGNGLPAYMEASMMAADGNTEAAMQALTVASSKDSSSSHALTAAEYQAAALTASGMDPDVARLLAASTAGQTSAAELMGISDRLQALGQQSVDNGDYQTAEAIYDALRRMGEQTVASATTVAEAAAGYDAQLNALDMYVQLAETLVSPATVEVLQAAIEYISTLDQQLQDSQVNAWNQAMGSNASTDALTAFLDSIFSYGETSTVGADAITRSNTAIPSTSVPSNKLGNY